MVLDVKTKVYIVIGGTSVVSAAAGAAASYFVTKKFLTTKYEQLIEEELADAKAYYKRLNKVEEFSSPVDLLKSKVDTLGYTSEVVDSMQIAGQQLIAESEVFIEHVNEEVERVSNIFEEQERLGSNFDYEAEKELRTGDAPYIISHDEFYENVGDWDQVTLTYFEDDDVLCDESETPVPDSDSLVGDKNLTRFGAGSKDNNVVYIQNDHLQMIFEVCRNKGNYAKDVLGFIEHAEHRGLRKFRSDDE